MKNSIILIVMALPLASNLGATDYVPMLQPDREWEYVKKLHVSGMDPEWDYELTLTSFRLGEPCEEHGKMYYPVVLHDYKSWFERASGDETLYGEGVFNYLIPPGTEVAKLREENGKVFLLLESLPDFYFPLEHCRFASNSKSKYYLEFADGQYWIGTADPGEEVLLYDFNVEPGDILNCWLRVTLFPPVHWFVVLSEAPVFSTSTINVNGIPLKEVIVTDVPNIGNLVLESGIHVEMTEENEREYGAVSVEGVGSVGHGTLCEPGGNVCPDVYGPYFMDEFEMFNNLYDLNGNVIYPGRGIQAPIPERVISIGDTITSDEPVYDIMGRRIQQTIPGSIYICGGKKFVAE